MIGQVFKLKDDRLDVKQILYYEGGEALAQAAQRSCGCLLPGSVQGQAGWGFEQPGLVEGVLTHGRAVGTRCSLRSLLPKPFYDSVSCPGTFNGSPGIQFT